MRCLISAPSRFPSPAMSTGPTTWCRRRFARAGQHRSVPARNLSAGLAFHDPAEPVPHRVSPQEKEVEDPDGILAGRLAVLPNQPGSVEFGELRAALAKLPPDQREALLLVSAQGFSYEEAAQITGTQLGTIKSRVNRARSRRFCGEPRRRPGPRLVGGPPSSADLGLETGGGRASKDLGPDHR